MKVAVIILICFLSSKLLSAQDAVSVDGTKSVAKKIFIYKRDTLIFDKPDLFHNISQVPTDMWKIAKAPFQKRNWFGLSVVAVSTAVLIYEDEDLTKGIRKMSDVINLSPQTDYHIIWKVGKTKILKVPKNINTTLYQFGEGSTSMMLAGGLWLYGKLTKDWRAINTSVDLAETFVTMGLTTQIMKRITGRESPFIATGEADRWKLFPSFAEFQRNTSAYDAFPSGHLATLMATITVLSANYPEKKWIKPVGYMLMGLSGWAMMNTEVHWAGDYPLAIATGYLSGKVTTWRHHKKQVIKTATF